MQSATLDSTVTHDTSSQLTNPIIPSTAITPKISSTPPDSSSDDKKEEMPFIVEDQSNWIDYDDLQIHPISQLKTKNQLAVHRELYEMFGIIAFAEYYNTSTRLNALQFISSDYVMLGKISYRYGERETIMQEMGWTNERFATSDRLLMQLQTLADEKTPKIDSSSKTILQNTYGFFTTGSTPISYQPLILQNDFADDGSTESYSLRIYPSVSKRGLVYTGQRFKKFTFSFLPFGTDLLGKTTAIGHNFEDTAILTEAMSMPPGKVILQIPKVSDSTVEVIQMHSLNMLLLTMIRLGVEDSEAICNLHINDYLLYFILLYLDGKISKFALNELIEATLTQKAALEKKLLDFFHAHNANLSFSSSLDNLFSLKKPKNKDYATFFLCQLGLQDRMPDNEDNNFIALIRSVLSQLGLNDLSLLSVPNQFNVSAINKDILEIAEENKRPILVKREKKDPADKTQQDEFFVYGNLESDPAEPPLWMLTRIPTNKIPPLCKLSFSTGILGRCNEQFNEELIDAVKTGHADLAPRYPYHMTVWSDFFRVVNNKNISINNLNEFLNIADAVTIAIATEGMSSHEVCSIENASRRQAQETEAFYTRNSDILLTKSGIAFQEYDELKRSPGVSRFSSNYSHMMPIPSIQHSNDRAYPVVMFIAVFDLCIGKNLPDASDNNTAFYLKDPHKHILGLAKHAAFFKDASRNGALGNDDARRVVLRRR